MHNSSFDIHWLSHIRAAAALLQAAAMVCAPPSCASTAVNTQLLSSAVPVNPRGQLLLCCCQYCGMCCCPAGNCCDRFLCIPLVPSSKGCLQHSGAIHHSAGPPALQALQPRQNLPASQGPGLAEGSIITHTNAQQQRLVYMVHQCSCLQPRLFRSAVMHCAIAGCASTALTP